MMVVWVAALLACSLALALLAPFWLCEEGLLLPSTIADSPERLAEEKQRILEEYLADERAFRLEAITKREWQQRQRYLVDRFIDMSRRWDYLALQAEKDRP
jgi:hypothetical protein